MTNDNSKSSDHQQCEDIRESLSAFIDGEVGDVEAGELETHLRACNGCEAHSRSLSALDDRLRKALDDTMDVSVIWKGMITCLDNEDLRIANLKQIEKKRRNAAWVWVPLVAAMLLVAVFSALPFNHPREIEKAAIITEANLDFETFMVSGEPLDVATTDAGAVRKWMATRLDFKLPEDISPPDGFTISGARLCSFLKRRLGFLHYQKGQSRLSLYVMKSNGLKLPDPHDLNATTNGRGRINVIRRYDELIYVAISDLPEIEVVAFVSRFANQKTALLEQYSQVH